MIEVVEDEAICHGFEASVPLEAGRLAQRGDEILPARLVGIATGVEHEAHRDIELAHGVLGTLEIAAHPVEAVSNARKHSRHSSTHVSLLPPPWDELTTSEPFSRATRVRPPGTICTLSP